MHLPLSATFCLQSYHPGRPRLLLALLGALLNTLLSAPLLAATASSTAAGASASATSAAPNAVASGNRQTATLLTLSARQTQQLGIRTQTLSASEQLQTAALPAQVAVPNEQLHIISAPLPGVVHALLVAPGMAVRQGQVVARLYSREALELQRDLRQTAAQAELSRQNWQRDQSLFKEGLIAEARLQASHAQWQQAEAAATERRQTLGLVGSIQADGMTLKAPSDGVVLEQHTTLGARLDSAASVYTIARLQPLWLEIQTPAELAGQLRPGMPVVAGTARGRIITIGATVQPASQSVLVRAQLDAARGTTGAPVTLRPGQTLSASIELAGAPGHSVPAAAVIHHAGSSLVFVAQPDGYRAVTVQVLQASGGSVRVSGLKPGEAVVTQGASGLKALLAGVGAE